MRLKLQQILILVYTATENLIVVSTVLITVVTTVLSTARGTAPVQPVWAWAVPAGPVPCRRGFQR